MQSDRLSLKTKQDTSLLEDLAAKADFYTYDDLKNTCEAMKSIKDLLEESAIKKKSAARLYLFEVTEHLAKFIRYNNGEIVCIILATLAGYFRNQSEFNKKNWLP